MPCFKGLAVSIHTPDGPLPEHSVQKTSRLSRISAFIPVPPARIPADSTSHRHEPSTFAISITLLTPGQEVPYSTPKPSADDLSSRGKIVGGLPGHTQDRGKYTGVVGPYVPLTTSPNETIAAYIYFDGRAKEEVATLLRKGEETWVNSRWVSVPESEGGGLAEREFLFREVGLEKWLNGLDLDGKDAAATIQRRREKLEKRRRRRKAATLSDDEDGIKARRRTSLRYGEGGQLENVSDDEASLSDTDSSDDDDPIPEAAGQIKVALFRVLASGEIKRGEYSPQFDAHDDDEETGEGANGHVNGENKNGASIDHTTSFAKPKTLDPKTISTQTVTGIDPTDKPYAVFTFLYRGERQLQKMGILASKKDEKAPSTVKRRSVHADFASLGPLKKEGTVGFLKFRDADGNITKKSSNKGEDDMTSDSDDDEAPPGGMKMEDDDVEVKAEPGLLSPEDAERTGQISEGVRKMKVCDNPPRIMKHRLRKVQLKRQHSAEPLNSNGALEPRKNSKSGTPSTASTPQVGADLTESTPPPLPGTSTTAPLNTNVESKQADEAFVGSPLKKHRASMAGFDDTSIQQRLGAGLGSSGPIADIIGALGSASTNSQGVDNSKGADQFGGELVKKEDEDDEL